METKRCSSCRQDWPRTEFNRHPRAPDGLQYKCRACASAKFKDWWNNPQRGKLRERNAARALVAKTKICARCGKRKPKVQFYKQAQAKGGFNPSCKLCVNAYNRARETEQQRARWNHAAHLRHSTGMDAPTYAEVFVAQDGLCAICKQVEVKGRLSVDHDHACCPTAKGSCGKCVRALLCKRCNTALGMAGDDPDLLRQMADYIERYRE